MLNKTAFNRIYKEVYKNPRLKKESYKIKEVFIKQIYDMYLLLNEDEDSWAYTNTDNLKFAIAVVLDDEFESRLKEIKEELGE